MISLERAVVPPDRRFRRHTHETCHVVAVLAGGFVEAGPKERRDVGPGMVRVSPPARHDIDFGPAGAQCLVVEADRAVLGRLDRSTFLSPDPWLSGILTGLGRAESGEDGVVELLAQIRRRLDGRRRLHPPTWLVAARELLADSGGTLSLSDLADRVGVHRVHLAREFRDHFGMPVGECARRRRVSRARALLRDSDLPLSQVALEAGFADQSHLTRAFRAACGTTPARFRAENPLRAFKTRAVCAC